VAKRKIMKNGFFTCIQQGGLSIENEEESKPQQLGKGEKIQNKKKG
jgi:hypothetical protein